MKRNNVCLAITVMALATIISVAVVSCKKETQNAPLKPVETLQGFNPLEIEDMNAYLDGFRTKMQSSAAKGDDEALSLEDAAWHISSLANYEFANVNVECDGVRFDTLYAHVNVTNGAVLLSDLAVAYETISSSIDKFFNGLTLNNKHFRFIDAYINENGEITIPLFITYSYTSKDLPNHTWYFEDEFVAVYACDTLFPDSLTYQPGGIGRDSLETKLNQVVSHPYFDILFIPVMTPTYYIKASERVFNYEYYTDPYGSDFNNSRLFNHGYPFLDELDQYEMCYLIDSYLGLGFDNCPTNQEIVKWEVIYGETTSPKKQFHTLKVTYGILQLDPTPGHNDH